MKVSRGKDGFFKCKWKGCSSSATCSINSLLNHLKIEHNVEATYEAKNVPTLPWPPVTADELLQWGPKRGPNAVRVEFPPSQSQGAPSNQGIRSMHAVGRPSPQPFNHAPRGPAMDQAGLPSAPSSAHDDVPPPHTPLKKSPAPALSQLRRASLSPNAFAFDASQVSSFNGVRLKRDRSPSPVHGSSKRVRLESPCSSPSVISRVASFVMTPLKRRANFPARCKEHLTPVPHRHGPRHHHAARSYLSLLPMARSPRLRLCLHEM